MGKSFAMSGYYQHVSDKVVKWAAESVGRALGLDEHEASEYAGYKVWADRISDETFEKAKLAMEEKGFANVMVEAAALMHQDQIDWQKSLSLGEYMDTFGTDLAYRSLPLELAGWDRTLDYVNYIAQISPEFFGKTYQNDALGGLVAIREAWREKASDFIKECQIDPNQKVTLDDVIKRIVNDAQNQEGFEKLFANQTFVENELIPQLDELGAFRDEVLLERLEQEGVIDRGEEIGRDIID